MRAAILIAALAGAARATVPTSGLLAWLTPSTLPKVAPGASVSRWPNALTHMPAYDAVTDTDAGAASPPTLAAAATSAGEPALQFTSPGLYGVGSNLIITVNLAMPGQASSLFLVARPTSDDQTCQRLLAAKLSNFALGFWNSDNPFGVPLQDMAYASPSDDGVFLCNTSTPVTQQWVLYELIVDGSAQTGAFYRNGSLLATGPAVGPYIPRLGGGHPAQSSEYGSGLIAEVLVYGRALTSVERKTVEAYLMQKYLL